MTDLSGRERLGRALQALAADLATEQQRVMRLRRENRELRAQLAALQEKYERTTRSNGPDPKLEAISDAVRRASTRPSG